MSRISRDSFVADHSEAQLDVGHLGGETRDALVKAGLSEAGLREIAVEDGVIDGAAEAAQLFDFIDRADRNGSRKSIDTTRVDESGHEGLTRSGGLHEALEHEIAKSRLNRGASVHTSAAPQAPTASVTEGPASATKSPATLPNGEYRPSARAQRTAVDSLRAQGFTDIHLVPNTPYFNQADAAWAKHDYPKHPPEPGVSRTIRDAGCAPTALAMADAALRGSGTGPNDVADFAVERHFSGKVGGHGSDTHGLGKAWAKEHDLTYTPATSRKQNENVDVLRSGLAQGGIAVISVGVEPETGKGHFTKNGHVMVINGCAKDKNGTEWFFVVNPGRRDQSQGRVLTLDDQVVQDNSLHLGAGQLRISRDQLMKELKHGFVLQKAAN